MKAGVCGPTGVNVILGSGAGAVDFGFDATTRGFARAAEGAADPFTGSDMELDADALGVGGAITAGAATACAAPSEVGVPPETVCGKAAIAGSVAADADTATAGAVAVTAGGARAGGACAARPLPAAGFPPAISQ